MSESLLSPSSPCCDLPRLSRKQHVPLRWLHVALWHHQPRLPSRRAARLGAQLAEDGRQLGAEPVGAQARGVQQPIGAKLGRRRVRG